MLMVTERSRKSLRPIASALSPEDFAFIERRALAIAATLDGLHVKRNAEVYPGVTPHWHVATVMPGQERAAADDLSERCFGIYLPESEDVEVRRGRRVEIKRLMLPGYVFVFVWDVDRHMDRIRACDGVRGMLFLNGRVAIVPDGMIDRIRMVENQYRPLKGLVQEPTKKQKRCWRKSRIAKLVEQAEAEANEIVSVHSYSPFIEALRQNSDEERVSAFHKALGLVP